MRIETIDGSSVKGTAGLVEDHTTVYNPTCGLANAGFREEVDVPSLVGGTGSLSFSLQRDNTFTAGNGATGAGCRRCGNDGHRIARDESLAGGL